MSRSRVSTLACLLAALGCRAESPTEFPMRRPFQLASWSLVVGPVERLAVTPSLQPQLRGSTPDADMLAVHLELTRSAEAERGQEWRESPEYRLLKIAGSFRLRDAEGNEYPWPVPVLEPHYEMMKPQAGITPLDFESWSTRERNLNRWILLFAVPRESRGFSLYIRNRRPQEGEPRLAVVHLDR